MRQRCGLLVRRKQSAASGSHSTSLHQHYRKAQSSGTRAVVASQSRNLADHEAVLLASRDADLPALETSSCGFTKCPISRIETVAEVRFDTTRYYELISTCLLDLRYRSTVSRRPFCCLLSSYRTHGLALSGPWSRTQRPPASMSATLYLYSAHPRPALLPGRNTPRLTGPEHLSSRKA